MEEEFGIVDIERLAKDEYQYQNGPDHSWDAMQNQLRRGFINGFNKCLKLNKDKLYTVEQMKDAFESGENYGKTWSEFYNTDSISRVEAERTEDFNGFIQSLQPKTEFEIELQKGQMKLNDDGEEYGFPDMTSPKITNNTVKITKILWKNCLYLMNKH